MDNDGRIVPAGASNPFIQAGFNPPDIQNSYIRVAPVRGGE
jgi:hypothetical protein